MDDQLRSLPPDLPGVALSSAQSYGAAMDALSDVREGRVKVRTRPSRPPPDPLQTPSRPPPDSLLRAEPRRPQRIGWRIEPSSDKMA
eukprot:1176066-Prorocentrum_minimum.AAC.2